MYSASGDNILSLSHFRSLRSGQYKSLAGICICKHTFHRIQRSAREELEVFIINRVTCTLLLCPHCPPNRHHMRAVYSLNSKGSCILWYGLKIMSDLFGVKCEYGMLWIETQRSIRRTTEPCFEVKFNLFWNWTCQFKLVSKWVMQILMIEDFHVLLSLSYFLFVIMKLIWGISTISCPQGHQLKSVPKDSKKPDPSKVGFLVPKKVLSFNFRQRQLIYAKFICTSEFRWVSCFVWVDRHFYNGKLSWWIILRQISSIKVHIEKFNPFDSRFKYHAVL